MTAGWNTSTHFANAQAMGASTATSSGVTLTSGASNVKGAWSQVIASTASDITHLLVCFSYFSAGGGGGNGPGGAIDVAVAPSGSEASGILIQNLIVPMLVVFGEHFLLPVGQIPAGSRIAARFASSFASDTVALSLVGFDSGWSSASNGGLWDTYGWSGSGAIQGFAVDPGATINVKGSYVALSTSVTNDLSGFFITWDVQNRASSTGSYMDYLVDFALGGIGSEVVILPNVMIARNSFTGGVLYGPQTTPFLPIPIAAGSRLSCRAQAYNVTALDRILGVSVYGLRA
jgi:hypothetical protein